MALLGTVAQLPAGRYADVTRSYLIYLNSIYALARRPLAEAKKAANAI
jgi:hypothetical protein